MFDTKILWFCYFL